jgi:CheY-like chemotaxis protein
MNTLRARRARRLYYPRGRLPPGTILRDGSRRRPSKVEARNPNLTRRVLVIEDDRDSAEGLRLLLERAGHRVAVVHGGVAALEQARSFLPEAVVCDLGLPGDLDGFEVARAIRGLDALRSTLLIALTGHGFEQERSAEAGFDSYLTKPIDPDALRALLANPTRQA